MAANRQNGKESQSRWKRKLEAEESEQRGTGGNPAQEEEKAAGHPARQTEPGPGEKPLSRKQWRNKMKNKKRNKNKFKPGAAWRDLATVQQEGQLENGGASMPETGTEKEGKRKEGKVLKEKGKDSARQQNGRNSKPGKVRRVEEDEEINRRDSRMNRGHGKTVSEGAGTKKEGSEGEKVSELKGNAERNRVGTVAGINKRKLEKLKRILKRTGGGGETELEKAEKEESQGLPAAGVGEEPRSEAGPGDRSAALRLKMEERLKSGRFRYLNQQFYTSSSKEARRLFQQDKDAFEIYHQGFAAQVGRWPQNPIDKIISYIRNRPASLVVADFGCGDCKLARSVRNQVHSFDLVALNEHVTVCDMAHVSLPDKSVDIAVFCLSLMGTNLRDFIQEANRVLCPGGTLIIAEVASRFEDVRNFLNALACLGFKVDSKETENKYFFLFHFTKTGSPKLKSKLPGLALKACVYKKR
uniref:Ribosomal RNA-processing protein 8 n=1 Tax=Latimeria chalumnae TaxID=7897 RepID=H2ZVH4_LATCH